ncbi:hypothetical protein GGI43DRAFT_405275 [Trichoderma evansii]
MVMMTCTINGHRIGYFVTSLSLWLFRAHALIALHWALLMSGAVNIIHVKLWSAPLSDSMWRDRFPCFRGAVGTRSWPETYHVKAASIPAKGRYD